MRYFKRTWDEPRGDEFERWGTSTWYFELGDNRYPLRQVEVYADGTVLKYDESHSSDRFGGLGDQPLDLDGDFLPFEIDAAEFERAWVAAATNR